MGTLCALEFSAAQALSWHMLSSFLETFSFDSKQNDAVFAADALAINAVATVNHFHECSCTAQLYRAEY